MTNEEKKLYLIRLKNKRWEVYKQWTRCYCPALNTYVNFTVDGFFHLHTEPSGRVRTVREQLHKFGLLSFAPIIIKNCPKFITYDKRMAPIGRKKVDGKPIMKEFEYWGLNTEIINKSNKKPITAKVVVRKLAGSQKVIFWSIMD